MIRKEENMKKRLWINMALLAAAAAVSLNGCATVQGRTLKVGVKGDVPNFGLYDEESGRYSGMEVDLAQILCEDLGYSNVAFTMVDTVSREELLEQKRLDMVIATFSITDERKQRFDFSTPYYADNVSVMVEKSSLIQTLADLNGCRIGVISNVSQPLNLAEYLAAGQIIPEFDRETFDAETFDGGITFALYDTYSDISKALEYGDVDAFMADGSILSGYMQDDRLLLPVMFSQQQYGVATPRGSRLTAKVDEAVKARLEDGTIDGLIKRWGN